MNLQEIPAGLFSQAPLVAQYQTCIFRYYALIFWKTIRK
jgi:hypothetical protein